MSAHKTVMVRIRNGAGREEALAAAAVTPGQAVMRTSADKFQKHNAAGAAVRAVAVEDDLQGKGIGDDYAANTILQAEIPSPGDLVNMLLADGETVVIGTEVVSNGDGDVRVATGDSAASVEEVIGTAREALDLSDSSGADPSSRRLLVQWA